MDGPRARIPRQAGGFPERSQCARFPQGSKCLRPGETEGAHRAFIGHTRGRKPRKMLEVEHGVARIGAEVSVSSVVQQSPLDQAPLQAPCALPVCPDTEFTCRTLSRVPDRFDAIGVAREDLIVDRPRHPSLVHHQHTQ